MNRFQCGLLAMIFITATALCGCGTYTTIHPIVGKEEASEDVYRCGAGLGVDNKVGLIIKKEADKRGGEYSVGMASEIRATIAAQGLMTGDEKKYDLYIKCLLEFDKRRTDKEKSAQIQRVQQPALKVYLAVPKEKQEDVLRRRVVVENTGEELTELQVLLAPFLYITDLCLHEKTGDCAAGSSQMKSRQSTFIPIDYRYYDAITRIGSYKGEVFSTYERAPSKLSDAAKNFADEMKQEGHKSMSDFVLTLARIRYKDKFQVPYERYIDISFAQKELPAEMGKALFQFRDDADKEKKMLDGASPSPKQIKSLWTLQATRISEQPELWRNYARFMGLTEYE